MKDGDGETRRREVIEFLQTRGDAAPADLAKQFGVSTVTMHRDLTELERRGVVRRFHGGVTALPSSTFESLVEHRLTTQLAHKRGIAERALEEIRPGMSIMLDDSTTALQLVELLPAKGPLTVVTNFLRGLRRLGELSKDHDLTVVAIGGRYDPGHDSFGGLQAEAQVRGLRVDAAFISTSAVSDTGLYYQENTTASLKRLMIESANQTYLLIDHTKLRREALLRVAPVTDMSTIITDTDADPVRVEAWRRAGITCHLAPPKDHR